MKIYRLSLLLLGFLLVFNSCDSDNDDPIVGPDVPPAEEDSNAPIITSENGSIHVSLPACQGEIWIPQ